MWFLYAILIALLVILHLQETRRALLPSTKTTILWYSVVLSIAGVLVLRSGWRRDADWRQEQLELGTLSNSFYAPRREAITQGFAVAGGVFVGLWWGASTWSVLLTGIRRLAPGRGLLGFEVAIVVGVLTGGILGAVAGVYVGDVWERRHRRNRLRIRRLDAARS